METRPDHTLPKAAGMDKVCPEGRSGSLFPRQRKPSVEPAGFAEAAAQERGADRRAVQRDKVVYIKREIKKR
jgi:hypothetical protein